MAQTQAQAHAQTLTPPLLFTKRLTTFLSSYLSPTTHTLLLTTGTGRLLAHASSSPASALRVRATVAAGLVRMFASAQPAHLADEEGYGGSGSASEADEDADGASSGASRGEETAPICVTAQMAEGIFAVRSLRCGLLLVAVGPEERGPAEEGDSVGSGTGSGAGPGVRGVGEEVARALEGRLGALRVPGDVVAGE